MKKVLFALAVMAIVGLTGCKDRKEIQSTRSAIDNDLTNIAAHAYQYRIRPASMEGGGGSYVGYVIPEKMRLTELAEYRATVIAPDTLKVEGISRKDTLNTIIQIYDQDSRSASRVFTCDFK